MNYIYNLFIHEFEYALRNPIHNPAPLFFPPINLLAPSASSVASRTDKKPCRAKPKTRTQANQQVQTPARSRIPTPDRTLASTPQRSWSRTPTPTPPALTPLVSSPIIPGRSRTPTQTDLFTPKVSPKS